MGGWRRAQRVRLPTRPLSHSHITREEARKRQAWGRYRTWSRLTRGVWLSVLGAVQYGTSRVFYQSVPHCDAQAWRQYIPQIMGVFGKTGKTVVMVVERSGIHRAGKRASALEHDDGQFQCHLFPAHCGHHLNPLEGVWRVRKDAIGAGRGFPDLPQLSQRTRRVLLAPQERPLYEFHW